MKSNALLVIAVVLFGCVQSPKSSSKKATDSSSTPDSSPTPFVLGTPIVNVDQVDPLEVHAWHLKNTGQSTFSSGNGTPGADLNIGNVMANGMGVLVAVSDNGVEKDHEDLASNFSLGFSKNYSLSSPWFGDPSPGSSAHGTAVSGIIAGTYRNGLGSRGIAYKATIAGLKYVGTSATISKQVDQANGNYDIFNYSYGGYSCYFDHSSATYISQLEYGVTNLRGGKGAIYVKAAGNEFVSYSSDCDESLEGSDDYYLGNANLEQVHSYPWMIVVGALNANGVSSSYSTPGSSLWISAPGGEFGTTSPAILTTDLSGCDKGYSKSSSQSNDFEDGSTLNPNCNYTSTMNGTSSATPMVSGVVALLLQVNPNLSWRDVKHILATTAKKVDANSINIPHPAPSMRMSGHTYDRGWITNQAGYHFHNWYGFGAVDVTAAVAMASNYNVQLGTFNSASTASSSNLNLSIPDASSTGVQNTLGFASNLTIESVQVTLDVEHPWVGDLGVELTSPSGTVSTLMNINSGVRVSDIDNEVLLTNAFYGEPSQGYWKIKIIDGYGQDVGKLNKWSIKVFGH